MALRKKVSYTGLKDLPYDIVDTDSLSLDYFRIIDFPDNLQAGKNLIKIRSHPENFANGSEIYIEILDFNGDPIYYEPLNYLEPGGTRVISIYIYPDTAPGGAMVYLAGRATRNVDTGESYKYSTDSNNINFRNIPNLLWQRPVTVEPTRANNSEIIFTNTVGVTISENIQPYYELINYTNLTTVMTSNGATLNASQYNPTSPGTDPPIIYYPNNLLGL